MLAFSHGWAISIGMDNKLIFNFDDANDSGFLPDFCDVRIVFMLVLLVEILAIVLAMASFTNINVFWAQLAFYSLLMQWIGLINAAVLCNARHWLNKQSIYGAVAGSFCLMMLVSFLVCLIATKLNTYLNTDTFAPLSEYFLLRSAIMSAVIYSVLLRYFYIQQQWKLILQASASAEIQSLRARIRPHFLFNSMNTIASLISFQPDKAEKAVEDLSDLFRASLKENNENTLNDELTLIRSYLDIETLRLGERLKLQWNIDKNAKDKEIPSLILQPLVENAIYHGIEPLPEGGEIAISAILADGHLSISVRNPVTALTRNRQHKGNKMAQDNIRQRLQLVYGGHATFTTNETKEDYLVTLKIPVGGIREPL